MQQCFLNESIFASGDVERGRLQHGRDRLVSRLKVGANISPLDVVVRAASARHD